MPLAAGTRLGAYEVVAQLGAGGMGDGQRFLMIKEPSEATPQDARRIVVVVNWTEELKARMVKK
jgi:hypothetical protein